MKRYFYYILPILFFLNSCSFNDIEFNSDKWKDWVETTSNATLRWDMRNDLIRKYELIGMSVDKVIDLLGEPDEGKTEKEYRYYLGMARRGIDTGSLVLKIENGKVIQFRVWHG